MDTTKEKRSFSDWVKRENRLNKLLFRSIPSTAVAIIVVSVVAMNLMAGKIILSVEWLALTGGVLISWIPFLAMDVVTKHFGAGAANRLSIFAIVINLACVGIFAGIAAIPVEGADYSAFNATFSSVWFILLGSTIAFVLSAIVNNFSNELIGRIFKNKPDGKLAYFTRTYVSTFIGQMIDNIVFVLLTYMLFAPIFWGPEYGWTFLQCFMCSLLCALFELALEAVFSPIGYWINSRWKKEGVGEAYLQFLREGKTDD